MTRIIALIVAAGRGTRAENNSGPKQYVSVGGAAILAHAMKPFLAHSRVSNVMVVIHGDDSIRYNQAISPLSDQAGARLMPPVHGGATRQASVARGLAALRLHHPDMVLIHDAARPYVTGEMLDRLLDELVSAQAAILATPLADTLKRSDVTHLVQETIPRADLWCAETPQAFRFVDILAAHEKAERGQFDQFTDDASIAEWAGIPVVLVDSGGGNNKITTTEDLAMAEQRLTIPEPKRIGGPPSVEYRTGQGYDVHRFNAGDHVWLCGIRIPHDRGVEAHSDGDVALHALTDALLGAIGDGDIGVHFKNTDPRWRGAASAQFVLDARRRVESAGGRITHVDVTILAEAPKIGSHREAMKQRISELVGLPIDRIGLKATTTEGLGFIGERKGLAAMALATVTLPSGPVGLTS
jgi:2-C-methyl-D-erythritol 4-phosphate cytidylyltransferase/2-C-methyl-D-erythritol 2,4-cyclodiphosphate synthase